MRSILRYALSAALATFIVAPVFAQDMFPDTPENHWAYEALENLKRENILVGYPDGLYRGGRPASRYEMAVAIYNAFRRLKGITDGLEEKIRALEEQIGQGGGGETGGLRELRDQLGALRNDVNSMRGWGDDIANLKRLADTFEKEIASLGVDVESMKKDLASIEERVSRLERQRNSVTISGDGNFLVLAGHGKDDTEYGITPDGRLTGVGRGDYAVRSVGLTRDLTILHEAALRFSGELDGGPKWRATLVTGNMLSPNGLGSQGSTLWNQGFQEGNQDVYFQDFNVSFDTSLAGLNFGAEVGRVGYHISPFIFQRKDYQDYFSNERWDSNDWIFDGAVVRFDFGGVKLHTFLGRTSDRNSVNGTPVNSFVRSGNPTHSPLIGDPVDQMLGVRLNVPIGDMGGVNLAYLWLDSNSVSTVGVPGLASRDHNRTNVYGGDINLKLGGNLVFEGGFSKTPYTYNTSEALDDDNTAWYAQLGWDGGNWGVTGGYYRIEPYFGAPGDWERVGLIWNPTDVTAIRAKAYLNLGQDLRLSLGADFYEGIGSPGSDTDGPFTTDDDIRSLRAQLDYNINPSWGLMASYEDVEFKNSNALLGYFDGGGNNVKPTQRWFTVGLKYNLAKDAKLGLRYQVSDVDFKNSGFENYFGLANNRYRGGLLSSELTFRF